MTNADGKLNRMKPEYPKDSQSVQKKEKFWLIISHAGRHTAHSAGGHPASRCPRL